MEILDRAFCIFPITLGRVDFQKITNKLTLLRLPIFPRNISITGGFGENLKKSSGGSN